MTPFSPTLTPEQARAAATSYGWSVLPHDNGGFFAQSGQQRMIVVFNEDGSFRCAHIREGRDGMDVALMEWSVVGEFARHGRPVDGEEKNA